MIYLYLAVAIISEVIATMALKYSDGFTRVVPSIIVLIGYSCAFFFLSIVLRQLPVGITYAIWAGLGIVLTTLASNLLLNQKLDAAAFAGMGLIITGVCIINLFSKSISR